MVVEFFDTSVVAAGRAAPQADAALQNPPRHHERNRSVREAAGLGAHGAKDVALFARESGELHCCRARMAVHRSLIF
jgi:hypothetical protein